MKVKRIRIIEILRSIWLFSVNKIKSSESDKAVTYNQCSKMKRDAQLKAVFFPRKCYGFSKQSTQTELIIAVEIRHTFSYKTLFCYR